MKKKLKENQLNQRSFYFEDYLETNKKNKILKIQIVFVIEFIYCFFSFFP